MLAPSEFRYAFLPAWRLQTSITTAAVIGTMLAKALIFGNAIEKPDILVSLGIAAFCAACVAIPVLHARFKVSQEGLRTFSTFGAWAVLPWQSISHVKPTRYYFLPHLRIRVDGRAKTYWLPLHLHDLEGLRMAVEQIAGIKHPLYMALPVPARETHRVEA